MKIIEDKHNRFPRTVHCSNCGSVIELENGNDVIVHRAIASMHYIYEQRPYIYQWVCPLCNEFNKIDL